MTDRAVADVTDPRPAPADERSLAAAVAPALPTTRRGGATRSSTRSTSAASPTATATAPATSPASGHDSPTCATSASTRSGSPPGTSRRSPTAATTSRTTARSTRPSGRSSEAEALIAEALELGIRTIIDIVPNHVSDRHPWFQAALAAGPGSPERDRFWFRPGRGDERRRAADGLALRLPGRRPGRRTTNPDGTPGEWYLHLFTPEQPDLNWDHPDVRAEHEDILRFWFDRGVAGVRIDSAALLVKDPTLPEVPDDPGPGEHPTQDRDELHDIYRGWRAVADAYPGTRVLVGELWLPDIDRFADVPAPGRAPHRVQLRLHGPAVGRRRACARRSTRRSPRTRRSARRRPGSSRTTTSPGR